MTHWRQARFAVVDLETTGLNPDEDEILSVGIVHVDDGAITAASAFYSLVRPRRMPPPETIVVHGIRPADLREAAEPAAVAPSVLGQLAGREVVAHVAGIEEEFLGRWLGRHAIPADFIDTDVLMRLHVARTRRLLVDGHVGLGAASDWFGLPEQRRHHALGDALTTAQLFLALSTLLATGGMTVPDMYGAPRALAREHRRLRRRRLVDSLRGRTGGAPTDPQQMEDK